MPNVVCDAQSLRQDRRREITKRLQLVSDAHLFVAPNSKRDEFVLTVRSGEQLTSDVRRWSFPSRVDSVVCQYGERWRPTRRDAQEFRLQSVYFHLLQHRGRDEEPKEIVAFHWHAVGDGSGYSNLPHLHVKVAADPLHRSHFGVALTAGPAEQDSVTFLDQLLDETVSMVDAEVLKRVGSSKLSLP